MKKLFILILAFGSISAFASNLECINKLRGSNRIQADVEYNLRQAIYNLIKNEMVKKEITLSSLEVNFILGDFSSEGRARYTFTGSAQTARSFLTIEEAKPWANYINEVVIVGKKLRDAEGVPVRVKCQAVLPLPDYAGIEVRNTTYDNTLVTSIIKNIELEF